MPDSGRNGSHKIGSDAISKERERGHKKLKHVMSHSGTYMQEKSLKNVLGGMYCVSEIL